MNTYGRDILAGAQVDGIPQLFTDAALDDVTGGYSPIGLLLHHVGCQHLRHPKQWFTVLENYHEHAVCFYRVYQVCESSYEEMMMIREEGLKRWDFLTIAWQHNTQQIESVAEREEHDEDDHTSGQ